MDNITIIKKSLWEEYRKYAEENARENRYYFVYDEWLADKFSRLQSELSHLQSAVRWIPVSEKLPADAGTLSPESYYVRAQEFGCPAVYAIAKCWISSDTPLFAKWYLDRDVYNLDNLIQIAPPVTHWHKLPQPPSESQVDK